MGIGIGGDYPLSAVISSEFAATRTRGRVMTAVFAFQGWGNLGQSYYLIISPARLLIRFVFSGCSRFVHYGASLQESHH